jgi:glucokinase
MLLAGDIGGTNTRLALYDDLGKTPVREDTLSSRAFPSLEAAVRAFLGAESPRIAAAAFGIAGPVVAGHVKTTNLPWQLDEESLSRALEIPRVRLINDLVSIAFGASVATGSMLAKLQGERTPAETGATLAALAAGTGLGEAALVWDGTKHVPCGSEGGHSDFAPRTRVEWELYEYLSKRFGGHVSYERVVSGPGLGNVYDFFLVKKKAREGKANAKAIASAPDRNRAIAELGRSGKSVAARKALDVFLGVYGAEAGNLALKFLSTGGVFVAGGIAASLVPLLKKKGPFLEAFRGKGRFRPLLSKVPVAVVLDSKVGLAGAARYASMLLAG